MSRPKKKKEKSLIVEIQNFDTVTEIASFYGFKIIQAPPISKPKKNTLEEREIAENSSLVKIYHDENLISLPQPLMYIYERVGGRKFRSSRENREYTLIILGSPKSIAEGLLIHTVITILKEIGEKDLLVEINSLGDRESVSIFERKVSNYCRKKMNELPAEFRTAIRKNPYDLYRIHDKKLDEFKKELPQSIKSLNEESRIHFKEVIEFLESTDISYKINENILGNPEYAIHTIFEINQFKDSEVEGKKPLAYGMRFDDIIKKLDFRKNIPAIGVSLFIPSKKIKKVHPLNKPFIYLIQFGFSAKLKSLSVLEILRKIKIPVLHSLAKDKLAGQISMAESMDMPYTMIIGQKEAIDNTVVIRENSTRSQDIVNLENLESYMTSIYKKKK